MSEELAASSKYIIRAFNGKELGLTLIQPDIFPPPPRPVIELRPGVKPELFEVKKVGVNVYQIDSTVDIGGRLFSFPEVTPQKWVVVFRPNHRAFTIAKEGTENMWTAPEAGKSPQILVKPVKVIGPSHPPHFPNDVLFKFQRVLHAQDVESAQEVEVLE